MSLVDLIGVTLAEILGDFQLKFFAREHQLGNLFGGLAGYIGVIFFLIRSFAKGNVMYVNGMWDGLSALIEPTAAFILLGERFNMWYQYAGLVFVALGVFLLKMGKIPK
ncbi:hypothetical protein EBT25_04905 [bacterium]|nr:hypothetical protein [bacterium]